VLAGVRVIAIEQAVAGPLCTRHLADLGAEVIKIERPGRGDFARHYDSLLHGLSTHYVWLNRGKRSVALDLKSPDDRARLRSLLQDADVLVSNLAVGAIDRLVDLAEVRAGNPGLISCAISGYGPDGPYAQRKSFDLLVLGEAGITLNTGTSDQPAKPGVSLADLAGGSYAFGAVCAALRERERTGVGRHIEISLFDVMCEWMMPLLLAEQAGVSVPPAGMGHATITPYGPYTCADGLIINLAVQNDGQWQRLCRRALADPALADDPRFATNQLRLRHRTDCEGRVQARISRLDRASLEQALDAADVPWGRLNTTAEVLDHPQLAATDRWTGAVLPGGELVRVLSDPFRFTGRPWPEPRAVAALGADTDQVLAERNTGGSPATPRFEEGQA
jgi:crotonobetainyl-CoA:carnitine CoA-transferase CaiB-like acyl-CoA transferase